MPRRHVSGGTGPGIALRWSEGYALADSSVGDVQPLEINTALAERDQRRQRDDLILRRLQCEVGLFSQRTHRLRQRNRQLLFTAAQTCTPELCEFAECH